MPGTATVQPQMASIVALVPDALPALLAPGKSAKRCGLSATTCEPNVGSDDGKPVIADLGNFATGGVALLITEP